jgi:hypothetical protein
VLAVALLKEFLQLGVGRVGGDDGGEAKGGDKVNLMIEDGDKVNLTMTLHKEIFFQLINILDFF